MDGYARADWNLRQVLAWVFLGDRALVNLFDDLKSDFGSHIEEVVSPEGEVEFLSVPNERPTIVLLSVARALQGGSATPSYDAAKQEVLLALANGDLSARGYRVVDGALGPIPREAWADKEFFFSTGVSSEDFAGPRRGKPFFARRADRWFGLQFRRSEVLALWPGIAELLAEPNADGIDRGDYVHKNVIARNGRQVAVQYAGRQATIRRLKGTRYLHYLIAAQGKGVHVRDLHEAINPTVRREEDLETLALDGVGSGGLSIQRGLGDAGDRITPEAIGKFKADLARLRERVEDAEEIGDEIQAAVLREELLSGAEYLQRAQGLGGRPRKEASELERLRKNAQKAISLAIRHIREVHPELGKHLERAVTTGTTCIYAPVPPIDWEVAGSP